jgi:PPP family 3-phenylpropionic acid transporter
VIGALLGGLISEHWGLQSVFVASVLTSGVATAAAYKVWRLQHPRQGLA